MILLSSRATTFYKRILPAVWFGFMSLVGATVVTATLQAGQHGAALAAGVGILLVCLLIAVLFRWQLWSLADEVWDDGDALFVRNDGRDERISFRQIVDVRYQRWIDPPAVVIRYQGALRFDDRLRFLPPLRARKWKTPPEILNLQNRVAVARQESGNP